jgi:hypothetical protein
LICTNDTQTQEAEDELERRARVRSFYDEREPEQSGFDTSTHSLVGLDRSTHSHTGFDEGVLA